MSTGSENLGKSLKRHGSSCSRQARGPPLVTDESPWSRQTKLSSLGRKNCNIGPQMCSAAALLQGKSLLNPHLIRKLRADVSTPLRGIQVALQQAQDTVMIKYLNNRECPKCHSRVIVMLLRISSQISTVNGICGSCDHSMKWLIIRGNATATNLNLRNQTIATPDYKNGQAIN